MQRLPVPVASIILLDDDGRHFVQEVAAGDFRLDLPSALPWPTSVGAAGRCARTGEPVLIADVRADPDYVAGHPTVASEYLVPIRHRQRLLGVLNLESTRADLFTPDYRAVFDAIADQVAGAVHLAVVVRELELANRRLQRLSMQDGLTGIANRRCFDEHLQRHWLRLADEGGCLALLLVDVDFFKALNDACGHLYGDECLRELARLCLSVADGADDLVARYGGEELVLLLPGRALAAARRVAERLRRHVARTAIAHPASAVADHVTVSIGVCASRPRHRAAPVALIEVADRALYAAKAAGRNRVVGRGLRLA